jgi:hypothetical protein
MTRLRTTVALSAAAVAALAGTLAATGPASAATPQSVRACGNSSIGVLAGNNEGATGHGSFVVQFVNRSHSSCSLFGYPGLDALGSGGRVLRHARRTLSGFAGGASAERTIVITPGHRASATVEWLNFNPRTSGSCVFSTTVNMTAPNTTRVVNRPEKVSVCDLQIHPVVAGRSGNS